VADPVRAEERLAHVVLRLDIALVLDEAGIDARAFSPDELDRLSRMLVRRARRPPDDADGPGA
jgi:hypothetical protein